MFHEVFKAVLKKFRKVFLGRPVERRSEFPRVFRRFQRVVVRGASRR
jgi:hypothetical protein